ncbi:MAG: flavodoxin [Kiritimatiellae bacterium]|nr:flavodoxin [Kiritimatiellia bacterium]
MKTVAVIVAVAAAIGAAAIAGCKAMAAWNGAKTAKFTGRVPGKVAVVYYSQSKVGNTATVAKWIQEATGGDLVEIKPVEAYPEPYTATLAAAREELESGKYREIEPLPDMDGYDVVFVGTPIWYGTWAFPVAKFFEGRDFKGKTVVPFSTHGGGGAGRFAADVKRVCRDANVLESFTARGSNQIERRVGVGVTTHGAQKDVVEWLERIFGSGKEDATSEK